MSRLPFILPKLSRAPCSHTTSLLPPTRSFSLSAVNEKRRKGGCSKWKRGGLIQTSIYTGFKGQAPIPKPLHDFKSGDRNLAYDMVSPHTPQSNFRGSTRAKLIHFDVTRDGHNPELFPWQMWICLPWIPWRGESSLQNYRIQKTWLNTIRRLFWRKSRDIQVLGQTFDLSS